MKASNDSNRRAIRCLQDAPRSHLIMTKHHEKTKTMIGKDVDNASHCFSPPSCVAYHCQAAGALAPPSTGAEDTSATGPAWRFLPAPRTVCHPAHNVIRQVAVVMKQLPYYAVLMMCVPVTGCFASEPIIQSCAGVMLRFDVDRHFEKLI